MSNPPSPGSAPPCDHLVQVRLGPHILHMQEPDGLTLTTSHAVRDALTCNDPNGIYRPGWDVIGPWGVWIHAPGEPRDLRLPGSVGELTQYLTAYRELTVRRIRGLQRLDPMPTILKRQDRWRPSADVLWRMARIILPAVVPLPPLPEVASAEDMLFALHELTTAVAQVELPSRPTGMQPAADPGADKPRRVPRRVGRRKLAESTDPTAKAKVNVYVLIRAAMEQNPHLKGASLRAHFISDNAFKERVKEAKETFGKELFRAALAWMKRNPPARHETPSRNLS